MVVEMWNQVITVCKAIFVIATYIFAFLYIEQINSGLAGLWLGILFSYFYMKEKYGDSDENSF